MTRRSTLLATVAIPILSLAAAQPVTSSPLRLGSVMSQSQLAQTSLIEMAQAVICADGVEAPDQGTCDARQAEAEAQRQAQEAEAQQKQAAEAEAQRQAAEAEAQQKQAAEAEAQRQAVEAEAQQKQAAEAEAQRQAAEAEAQQKQAAEAEAQRQAAEAEAQQKQAAEAEAQRQAAEAEAQQKQAAEAEAQRQAAEAEAQQKQAAEAEAQRQAAEAEAKRQAQQPAAAPPATAVVTCADGSQAASADACPVPAPTAGQPAAQPPVAEQPTAQPPVAEQPAAQPPVAEQPVAQPPVAEQPAATPLAPDQPAVAQPDNSQVPAQPPVAEQPAQPADGQPAPAQQATEGQPPVDQQVVVPATAPPADAPVAEIVETLTETQKQEVAEDPSKTAETVVLPVDGGAAVLDSDKDADNAGGAASRETRTEQRAQEQVVAAPTSDAAAQADIKVDQQAMQATATEAGTRLQAAPTFAVPPTVVNNITNVTNVTNVTTTNNVNNGVVQNNVVNQVTEVKVIEQVDNRTIINVGNQVVVRSDDRERMRYDASETYYEELPRGRVRETVIRSDESRIVTIYSRYGDIIQRSRISPRGRESVLIYAPDVDREEARLYVDVGLNLPPMRLTVPVNDYIVTTSQAQDRDYYEFLAEPPVERVERVYSIDEVKSSSRLRDKVRRIDLDTITFPSGSAEVPLEQARTLRKVGEAIEKVLENDPGETFLIEGHTDAVGSDRANLILSDQRAETVASLLTDVYGIPPENLQVQGYGERYLKIRTLEDEQQNRRVAIRRVTSLVRPVAANQ